MYLLYFRLYEIVFLLQHKELDTDNKAHCSLLKLNSYQKAADVPEIFLQQTNIFVVKEELEGLKVSQAKAHPRFPSSSQYKVLLYLPQFGWNSNVKFRPPPLVGGGGWINLQGENGINRNLNPTFLFEFYAH